MGTSPFGRRVASFTALVGLSYFFIDIIDPESQQLKRRNLRDDDGSDEAGSGRPVMHTFFEPVEGGCCGMTEQGHLNLLKAWEDAWQSYGWETKVLNAADAKEHPDFETFENKLDEAHIDVYNRRCFWRWLAIAMLEEGGWMSDYDNFPLTLTGIKGMELETKPGFKSWAAHVPSLFHGDQSSLSHIVELMRDTISPDLDVPNLNDMQMLKYLYENLKAEGIGATVWEDKNHPGFPYVSTEDGPKIDCDVIKKYLTAHLSHGDLMKAFKQSTYPHHGDMTEEDHAEKRAEAAEIMMKDVREECAVLKVHM